MPIPKGEDEARRVALMGSNTVGVTLRGLSHARCVVSVFFPPASRNGVNGFLQETRCRSHPTKKAALAWVLGSNWLCLAQQSPWVCLSLLRWLPGSEQTAESALQAKCSGWDEVFFPGYLPRRRQQSSWAIWTYQSLQTTPAGILLVWVGWIIWIQNSFLSPPLLYLQPKTITSLLSAGEPYLQLPIWTEESDDYICAFFFELII